VAVNSYKDDEKLTEKSKAVTLKRLFSYLLAYKWQILLVLVLMFYGVAISLLNPIMIESAIDRYIGNNNIPGLFRLMGIALILNLFVVLAMKIRMYIMAKVCNNILLTIRQQLYTHIQKLDFAFFDSRPTGKILSRIIGDINSLKDVLSNSVTTLIPDMITVIAVVGIMFTKNPKLAAASLISTPFMVFGMFFIEVHAHPKWQAFRKKSSNLNAFIHEDTSGDFEWTANMVNINHGMNDELLNNCRPLQEYMLLIEEIRKNRSNGMEVEQAVDKAVTYCISNNILSEFLTKHRAEVIDVCITEYDEQAFVNGIREEGRQEGREEGRALTLYSLVNSGNLKPDIAAKELGISIHEFEIAMKEAGMNQPVSK